jgi:peptidoglycan/xylan/chitin deacetylase (PgdA/CDA1 family)
MTTDDVWAPLLIELDRWHSAGKVAHLWLRDDDAIAPTPALEQLLDLSARHHVPMTLAVIPSGTGQPLADRLAQAPLISVTVHGWSHTNHSGANEKKQELGTQRPAEIVLGELAEGFRRLRALYPDRFVPVLVPPWNRIAAPLIPALAGLGFQALSVFGAEKSSAMPMINTHVDLIEWHGNRGGRDHSALVTEIVKRLGEMFDNGRMMGLLTHHLVHDQAAWDFLEAVLARTTGHPGCRWTPLSDMLHLD